MVIALAGGGNEALIKKESSWFSTMQWTASRKGQLFCGCLPNGLGHLIYHMEGNRLLASMSLDEAFRLVKPDYDLNALSQEDVQELMKDTLG